MIEQEFNKMVGIYKIQSIHSIDQYGITIYNALNTQTKSSCSLKKVSVSQIVETVNKNNSQKDPNNMTKNDVLFNQIKILKRLKGNRFLKCYQILKTKNSIYYVYDRHPQISLKQLCNFINKKPITQKTHQNIKNLFNKGSLLSQIQIYQFQKISIVMQLLSIIQNLHNSKIIHNELIQENVFIAEGQNSVDEEGFKVSIGGFYKSQDFKDSQNFQQSKIKDLSALGNIMKALKIFQVDNSQKNLKAQKFSKFAQQLINVNKQNLPYLSISSIRQKLQKLTTSEFSSVKLFSMLDHSFGQSSYSKPVPLSRTTEEENMSFGKQSNKDFYQQLGHSLSFSDEKINSRKFSQSVRNSKHFTQLQKPQSNPLIKSQFRERQNFNEFNPQIKQKIKSISKNLNIQNDNEQANLYFKFCQRSIKIALKVCIFAIANKQKKLVPYFIQIIQNMIQTFKQKLLSQSLQNNNIQYWTQKINNFSLNTIQLKKMNPFKQYAQDTVQNIYLSDKGVKYGSKNISQIQKDDKQLIQNFEIKMLKAYQKYKDIKILVNTCLLISFYNNFDKFQSLRMKQKSLQKLIKMKLKIDQLNVQELREFSKKSERTVSRSKSIHKSIRNLSKSKQFKIN